MCQSWVDALQREHVFTLHLLTDFLLGNGCSAQACIVLPTFTTLPLPIWPPSSLPHLCYFQAEVLAGVLLHITIFRDRDRRNLDPWISMWKTSCHPEIETMYYSMWVSNIFYCVNTVSLEFIPQSLLIKVAGV